MPELKTPTPAEVLRLRIKAVEHELARNKEAVGLQEHLRSLHGARFRFSSGAEEMRHGGVSATCTAGGVQLVKNWVRAAKRKLAKLEAA